MISTTCTLQPIINHQKIIKKRFFFLKKQSKHSKPKICGKHQEINVDTRSKQVVRVSWCQRRDLQTGTMIHPKASLSSSISRYIFEIIFAIFLHTISCLDIKYKINKLQLLEISFQHFIKHQKYITARTYILQLESIKFSPCRTSGKKQNIP